MRIVQITNKNKNYASCYKNYYFGIVKKDFSIQEFVIGVASSGAHSNGYSLLRKILDVKNVDLTQVVDGRPLADTAMEPTRIYVKPILELCKQVDVHAMAHITGGGLPGNLPRVLPNGAQAIINALS